MNTPRWRMFLLWVVSVVFLFSGCSGNSGTGPVSTPTPTVSPTPTPTPTPAPPVHNITRGTYYFTIQAAIYDAQNGDEIVVAIGTYYENIDFMGKDIILRSSDPDNHSIVVRTIIDGGGKLDSVVKFVHGETKEAVLRGFTIHGGVNELGGGILIMGSSPTIEKNIITENAATIGGGIFAGSSSSPTISGNTITENAAAAEEGGGILVAESSSAVISGNTITGNTAKGKGGGIFVTLDSSVYSGGTPWNRVNYPPTAPPGNNVFSGNTHQNGQAGNGCHVYFE